MTWMRGASRHWPAAVTDTDRDMSKELNTVRKRETDTHTWSIHEIIRSLFPQSHQVSLQTLSHVHTSANVNAIRLIPREFFMRPSSRAAAKWSKTGESNTQPALDFWKKKKGGGGRGKKGEAEREQQPEHWQDCPTPSLPPSLRRCFHFPATLLTPNPKAGPREPVCTAGVWFPAQLETHTPRATHTQMHTHTHTHTDTSGLASTPLDDVMLLKYTRPEAEADLGDSNETFCPQH